MQRRRFLFWVSLGMFQVGEALRINALDRLAAATLGSGQVAADPEPDSDDEPEPEEEEDEGEPGSPDPKRRARHGRPPSRWLRSLKADELRIWLKTIDPPEAGVSGMTYWTHLTRDHSFDADKLTGLTVAEQAQLHAAAHDGY